MAKTSNSSTTMHGNPIKANTGKPDAKFPPSMLNPRVEGIGSFESIRCCVDCFVKSVKSLYVNIDNDIVDVGNSINLDKFNTLAHSLFLQSNERLKERAVPYRLHRSQKCEERMPQVPN